ncbi:hypothetical protein C8035_v004456 [Colletotrichum spinosum]|uniref:Uncharacterized protein n=1 Tax=Colletotrichum spinosum TaxID=1347390 RepID=A0A4V3HQ71_9PEZI|nr:hypothetical protein C8035_v004456 [Colletotrichum spinosum]
MTSPLYRLPIESLIYVCEDLYDDDKYASLAAFASASRLCYSVASGVLARTIKLTDMRCTASSPSLSEKVARCRLSLERYNNLGQVRRVILEGGAHTPDEFCGQFWACSRRIPTDRPRAIDKGDSEARLDNWISAPPLPEGEHVHLPHPGRLLKEPVDEEYWRPVADLLEKLSGLRDLLYDFEVQFPPCLLRVLHDHHPACRLRIRNFHLRSLSSPSLDPYEKALVSSPCLYGIHLSNEPFADDLDFHGTGDGSVTSYDLPYNAFGGVSADVLSLSDDGSSEGAPADDADNVSDNGDPDDSNPGHDTAADDGESDDGALFSDGGSDDGGLTNLDADADADDGGLYSDGDGDGLHFTDHRFADEAESLRAAKMKAQNAAVMKLVSQSAPNLKEVYLEYPYRSHIPMPSWPQLEAMDQPKKPAVLHSLGVTHGRLRISDMMALGSSFDLSRLSALQLNVMVAEILPFLVSQPLPSLVSLEIRHPPTAPRPGSMRFALFKAFMTGVRERLLSLRVSRLQLISPISVLVCPSLRTLDLADGRHKTRSAEELRSLAAACPLLEHLSVRVSRTAGSPGEAAAYRALAKMKRLREAHLTLDLCERAELRGHAAHLFGEEEDYAEEDAKELALVSGRHFTPECWGPKDARNMLANIAMDEQLVLSIFEAASTGESGRRSNPLASLRIEVTAWQQPVSEYFHSFQEEMVKPWTVKPLYGTDRLVATAVRPPTFARAILCTDENPLFDAFDKLWPGDGAWQDRWSSFALSKESV